MEQFKSKVALITGAANGIGKEIALQLDELGLEKLILLDIDQSSLEDLSSILKTSNDVFCLDLSTDVTSKR